MCFQRDLEWQFEELVNRWLIHYNAKGDITDPDPLFYKKRHYSSGFRKHWGEEGDKFKMSFPKLVTFRGGMYFFAPSISFFRNLMVV